MKTVFIFGAGASAQAGAPLMSNFIDQAHDLLRFKIRGVEEVRSDFEAVFKAIADLQRVHSKSYLDLDNIEIVFGAIEMALLLKKLGNRSFKEIKGLKKSLITLIYKTLEQSILFPKHDVQVLPPKPYDDFFVMLNRVTDGQNHQDPHQFSFITFNYDLCLDYALHFSSRPYDYHLKKEDKPNSSPLLKLHGSINWGLSKNKEIVPRFIEEVNASRVKKGCFFDLGSTLGYREHKGSPLKGPPVIVPPTWNKTAYHGQLSNVWAKASDEISQAENIIVIGYSLPETDSFFRYLYALGSDSSTRLRNFVVVDPDKNDAVMKRFRGLIGRGIEKRFYPIRSTFEKGISEINVILNNP